MRNKFNMGSVVICAMAVMLGFAAQARTFEFKQLKSTGTTGSAEYWWEGTEKSKSSWFRVKIGGATKIDDMSEMEIRAATVLKSVKDKKTGINDVATFEFDPINKGKAIFFMVSTGAAFSREHDSYWYGNVSTGWQLAGVIIEIWQKGKVVKHWSNMSGKDGKAKLTDNIKKLRINRDGHPSEGERFYNAKDFDNATEIYSVDQKGERVDIDEVLKPFRESEEGGKAASKGDDASAAQTSVKNTVAPKLRTCEFLLNKKFKKNAKFYLCLFSASWCPPCRAEMPRIAKTYAETLKDDPDIELIHFSRDQDEEKAMAWAKEHNVKFPVVRPRGGNPLDLHTRGIPHLFIVKADGTLIEEGHPMNIFNEEKFREIKGASATGAREPNADTCDEVSSDDMTGPYGVRMQPDPGCEKGALYVLKRLKDVYLPAAVRYYGDPFGGQKPMRVFTLHVKRNDGTGKSKYTGVSWGSCGDGIDSFTIGLAKGSDKWEMDLPLVASKILTVCSESDGAAFSIYANDFVRGEVDHYDPIPKIKEDIREGLRLRGEAEDKVKGRPWVLRKLAPTWAAFEELREKYPTLVLDYCNLKNSKYAKGELPQKISADQMVALMGEVTGVDATAIFKKHSAASVPSTPQGKIAVAEKLGRCDFLLNKDIKKDAKFYLCLFSASWCGPCRREMPRIAKTYAETLKDDPDIELIHFSCDQNDEKALAWAKEHDVKFPVVKPKGGNPLDLHSRGIPHLFIVKADGALVEEGHPMRIFNEEKFREIKSNK